MLPQHLNNFSFFFLILNVHELNFSIAKTFPLVNCLHKFLTVSGFLSLFQEIHAPILSLWIVKIVVISIFVAFSLASIVSSNFSSFLSFYVNLHVAVLYMFQFNFRVFQPSRHCAPEFSQVWNRKLFFPKIPIFRSVCVLYVIDYSGFW